MFYNTTVTYEKNWLYVVARLWDSTDFVERGMLIRTEDVRSFIGSPANKDHTEMHMKDGSHYTVVHPVAEIADALGVYVEDDEDDDDTDDEDEPEPVAPAASRRDYRSFLEKFPWRW